MEYSEMFYAHSYGNNKEPLIDHLKETGKLASEFAEEFGCKKLGLQLGLMHDVGKRTERFQKVLQHELKKIDHAIVAAECYADLADVGVCNNDFIYLAICHCLNAHHSILRGDFKDIGVDGIYRLPKSFDGADTFTEDRQKQNALSSKDEFLDVERFIKENGLILKLADADYPDTDSMTNAEKMLFVRMMQSCLVDADYSATAMFEDPEYAETVIDKKLNAYRLIQQLEDYHEKLVSDSDPNSLMNQLRNLVYHDAAEAGKRETNIFTLTAPTGTAKTLAMMRFALEHAKVNGKRKIIIVLPYLSITTQNTEVYQNIFGKDTVLEDDSMTVYSDELRMYADRWNSPIMVTTSVKFFETLQAAQASDLRRLHQMTNAVVIFDESQTLAADLTDITMKTLRGLTRFFKTTIVLSTATQPSYRYRRALSDFSAEEIIKDTHHLYQRYAEAKKTRVKFSVDYDWTEEDLVNYFNKHQQAICVANTTGKALQLYKKFAEHYGKGKSLYLSSRLCPDHKKTVIEKIRSRLENEEPCYLLSTQCVEAGVDFDFPAGGREYASLTSISQTAGRINRNGKRSQAEMLVYQSEHNGQYDFPSDAYRNEADITYRMAADKNRSRPLDTNSLNDIDDYYRKLYSGDGIQGHDKKGIVDAEQNCDIRAMAQEYQLISERNQCNVVVPYQECIDEFNAFADMASDHNYTIKKKDLYAHHGITVSVAATGKSLSFIQTHCHQLCLFSPDQNVPVNWYIADMDEIYDPETGLKTREDTEEGGMINV